MLLCAKKCNSPSAWFPWFSISKAKEEKCGDSLHGEHLLIRGPRIIQWRADPWAGSCDYWALVHGTGSEENRDSSKWSCRDIIFTPWWVSDAAIVFITHWDLRHPLKTPKCCIRSLWIKEVLEECLLSIALVSCRARPISSHAGSVGHGWRASRVPLLTVCIQRLCQSCCCLCRSQRLTRPTKPFECWRFIF